MAYNPNNTCEDCLHHEVCACVEAQNRDFPLIPPYKCRFFRQKSQYIQIKRCDDADWEVSV